MYSLPGQFPEGDKHRRTPFKTLDDVLLSAEASPHFSVVCNLITNLFRFCRTHLFGFFKKKERKKELTFHRSIYEITLISGWFKDSKPLEDVWPTMGN